MLRRQAQLDRANIDPVSSAVHGKSTPSPLPDNSPLPDLNRLLALPDEPFLHEAYRTILLREADPSGLHYYSSRLRDGIPRIQILWQIAAGENTPKNRRICARLRIAYLTLKARSVPGIAWFADLLCAARKLHLRDFLAGNDESFVQKAYHATLGRAPDEHGASHYLAMLSDGHSRHDVLIDLKLSPEGKRAGARVAGLQTLATLKRVRRAPVIRQIVDILSLPATAAKSLDYARTAGARIQQLQMQQQSELASVQSKIDLQQHVLSTVLTRLDAHTTQAAEISHRLDSVQRDVCVTGKEIGDRQIAHHGSLLDLLPVLAEGIRMPLLTELATAARMQDKIGTEIHQHADELKSLIARECSELGVSIPASIEVDSTRRIGELLKRIDVLNSSHLLLAQKTIHQRLDAQHSALLASLSALATEVKTPLLARFTAIARAQYELQKQLDRHILGLTSALSRETAQLGMAVRKDLDESRAQLLNRMVANHTKETDLADLLLQRVAHATERVLEQSATASHRLEGETAKLISALHDAESAISAKIKSACDVTLAMQDTVATRLTTGMAETANLIADHAASSERCLDAKVEQVIAAAQRTESAVLSRLQDLKADTLAAQIAMATRLSADIAETGARIAGHTSAAENHLNATAAQMIATARETESEILSQLSRMETTTLGAHEEVTQRMQSSSAELATTLERLGSGIDARFAESLSTIQSMQPTAADFARATADRLHPLLSRTELYAMTAARRLAVPCGPDSVLVRTAMGYLLCADHDHALIAMLLESADPEPGTRQLIQRLLGPGDTFVDVGANVGIHTLAAARALQNKGRIIAIEPHPQTARLLSKTCWMNGVAHLVQVHPVAAAETNSERALHLGVTSGHHSLFPLDERDAADNSTVTVHTVTLDALLAGDIQATLIKIDAEGAELEVLRGAAGVLDRSPDVGIIAEFGISHLRRTGINTADWLAEFTRHGFTYRTIHGNAGELRETTPAALDAVASINLFFARPDSPLWNKGALPS
ncbi:hypothetical protein AZKH_0248 [Azoarcus sp. KH32C]|nr:hypothetical protein AZKH_0248 [Azoarcus sp. KH32C]